MARARGWLVYVPPLTFFTIVTGILTNLTSEDLGNPWLWTGLVVSALITTALTVWIGRMTTSDDPVAAAAITLRRMLYARWKCEPAWRSVGEGGRLPVRWEPGSVDLFPANPAAWSEPVESDDGARLAALLAGGAAHSCLVVLGEAGSGKSELLLSALRAMIVRPGDNDPVPVLIPMTAWHRQHEASADEWLFQWLHDNFPFLRGRAQGATLSQALAEQRRLLLLLDGFDEIRAEQREQALYDLQQIAAQWPLVLTSRTKEYRAVQSAGRVFENAHGVQIREQEPDDALRYLQSRSEPGRWSEVREALSGNAVLRKALNLPLTVMLADAVYNRTANGSTDPPPAPTDLLSYSDSAVLVEDLQSQFIPVRYLPDPDPPPWTVEQARRALGYLARVMGPDTELRWWDLRSEPPTGTRLGEQSAVARPNRVRTGLTALAIVVWTALSAGLLNQWIFIEANSGITDAVRIAAAAVLSYFGLLHLTGQQDEAMLAATGAYIAGALSGSYDLAVVVGLVVGFSWRFTRHPKAGPVRHGTVRDAVLVGLAAAAVALAIRGAGLFLPLTRSLIEGFGGGALDGFASRWDQDADGWLATGLVTASVAWAGMVIARGRGRPLAGPATRPLRHGAVAFVAVALITCWADRNGKVEHAWMAAPGEGLAVGLAVWWVSYWSRLWSAPGQVRAPSRAVSYGLLAGAVTVALNLPGYGTRTDMHTGWARALADGIGTGLLVWLALDLPHRPHAARLDEPASPRQRVRTALPAAAGVVIGVLDAMSAGVGRGAATGIATGMAIYLLAVRRREPRVETGPSQVSPAEAGAAVLILVGLVAGFGYALMYGIIAALGCRVARDIAVRRQPSGYRPEISLRGAAAGALLGSVALLGAVFNHLPPGALVAVGLTSFVAGAFTFGVQSKDPERLPAASPFILYKRDRNTSILIISAVAVAIGVAVAVRGSTVGHSAAAGLLAATGTMLTYGLSAGVVVATAATRFPVFTLTRFRLWYRGETPWALMPFLNDAHEKRLVLRSSGAVYQFRHEHLQKQIAADYARSRLRDPAN